jgi:branched-chain amino acid transport system substrate-binding protein
LKRENITSRQDNQHEKETEMRRAVVVLILLSALMLVSLHCNTSSARPLRIGALFSLTGPNALYGTWCYKALEVATDIINDRGGIGGKKIELAKGDAVDPRTAASEATRLITLEKVPVIIGTQSSPRAIAASEVASRHKTFYWETAAEAERLTSRHLDYFFRTFCRSSDKAKPPVDYLKNHVAQVLGKNSQDLRIGIVYEQGDYGTDTAKTFADYAKANGLKIATMLSIDPAALDFSSDIMKLKAAKLDFLFVPMPLETLAVFYRQAKELGLSVPGGISGSGTVDGLHKLIKGKDVDYVLDVVAPWQINADFLDPRQQKNLEEFRKRYKEKFGDDPTYVSYLTFSSAMVFYESVLPKAGSLDPEALRKAAADLDIPDGGTTLGFGVKFFPPGNPQQGQNERSFAVITQYQNGKMVTIWPPKVQMAKPWCPAP